MQYLLTIFSSIPSTIIILLSLALFSISTIFNKIIFKHLQNIHRNIKKKQFNDPLVKQVIKAYNDQKRLNGDKINVQLIVEASISQYHINIWNRSYPLFKVVRFIQSHTSVFIILGVLGTFLGLTGSIGGLGGADSDATKSVLSGMGVAFNTSITGIILSLLHTFMTKIDNNEQMLVEIMLEMEIHLETNAVKREDNVLLGIYALHSSIKDILYEIKGLSKFSEEFEGASKHLSLFNEELSQNADKFGNVFKGVTSSMEQFVEDASHLNKNFSELFLFFKNVEETNLKVTSNVETTSYNIITFIQNQTKINELNLNIINKAAENIQNYHEKLEEFFNNHYQYQAEQVAAQEQFTTSLINKQESITDDFKLIRQETNSLVNNVTEVLGTFNTAFSGDWTNKFSHFSQSFDSGLGKLQNQYDSMLLFFKDFQEEHSIQLDNQKEYASLIKSMLDQWSGTTLKTTALVDRFNGSINDFSLDIQSGLNVLLDQQNRLFERFEGIEQKHSHLLNSTQYTIDQMDGMFNDNTEFINENITKWNEMMDKISESIEYNFFNKLNHSLEKFKDFSEASTNLMNSQLNLLDQSTNSLSTTFSNNIEILKEAVSSLERNIQEQTITMKFLIESEKKEQWVTESEKLTSSL
ncbi:MotA/TolQ/ExbB proton channel family protein [Neobacillus sp. D3-1R]|uniref:MotA/TolQ/ExbB proton channel family protein n=1 Tax=Neobacillus sp. D3-1R TaxID=3445778 RepID=UPI003FA0EB3D